MDARIARYGFRPAFSMEASIMPIIAMTEYCDRSMQPISMTTVRPADIVPAMET